MIKHVRNLGMAIAAAMAIVPNPASIFTQFNHILPQKKAARDPKKTRQDLEAMMRAQDKRNRKMARNREHRSEAS